MRLTSVLLLIIIWSSSFSQVEGDVNLFSKKDSLDTENLYYTDLTDKLIIKFTNSFKYTKLDIKNTNTKKTLKYSPTGTIDLGLTFNHKWLGLGVSVGLPSGAESDSLKGKTSKFDLQLNIYSKRIVIDALYQKYKGFYIQNPGDFTSWDSTTVMPQLPNMETYFLGASAYYIFNHKKFSYRAAYVRNVVQNKSKGSILAGPFLNIATARSPGGFVPDSLPAGVRDTFNISSFSSTSYGLAVGYTYSVVIVKKVFMNFSIVPGLGVKNIRIKQGEVEKSSQRGIAARLTYRFAFGYEHRWFLLGLTLYGTTGNIAIENYEFSPGAGMLRLFVAKRLNVIKKKK